LKKKILIIGSGKQSLFHLKILNKNKKVEVINRFLFSSKNKRKFIKELDFFVKLKIDLIIVSEPTYRQYYVLTKILKLFNSDIICEKPFCLNYKEAKKILDLQKKNNKKFFIMYQMRNEPYIKILKNIIYQKKLKDIFEIKINWIISTWSSKTKLFNFRNSKRLGGGVTNEYASHVIDYLFYIFGKSALIKKIKKAIIIKKRFDAKQKKLKNISAEDYIKILLYLGKIKILINISNVSKKNIGHELQVFARNGFYKSIIKKPYQFKSLKINYKCDKKIKKFSYKSKIYLRESSTKMFYKNYFTGKNIESLATIKQSIIVRKFLDRLKNK